MQLFVSYYAQKAPIALVLLPQERFMAVHYLKCI